MLANLFRLLARSQQHPLAETESGNLTLHESQSRLSSRIPRRNNPQIAILSCARKHGAFRAAVDPAAERGMGVRADAGNGDHVAREDSQHRRRASRGSGYHAEG